MKRIIAVIIVCLFSQSAFALKSKCGKLIYGGYPWTQNGYPYHLGTWTAAEVSKHTHVLMQSSAVDTNGWSDPVPPITHLLELKKLPGRGYLHRLVKYNGQTPDPSTYIVRGQLRLQNPAGAKDTCFASVAIGKYHL